MRYYALLAMFCLVDMFSECTYKEVKDTIIKEFTIPTSRLRIVVSTIAFEMGIDAPNVRKTIHWGPSNDIELYIQETGHAGRDEHDRHRLYSTMVVKVL